VILRYCRLTAAAAMAVAAAGAPAVARAQAPDTSSDAVAHDTFRLTPDAPTLSYPIVVDRTAALSVSLTASSSALRHVALVSPGGRVLPVESRAADAGARYQTIVRDPVPGRWSIEISADEPLDQAVDVHMVCTFDNTVRLALSGTGGMHSSGSPIRLALALFDGPMRNPALSIGARLVRQDIPAAAPVPVHFSDDGKGADELAGDGIFEAFVEPDAIGTFRLEVDADGTASTGAFRRSASGLLHIVARTAEITTFTTSGVDEDGDGRIDELVVSPVAMIREDDDYLVTVRLRGSNGREIERSARAALSSGANAVDVGFDAADLVGEVGVDGPYHVEEIAFLRESGEGVIPADVRCDLGETDAFAISSLRPSSVRLIGQGTAAGVDTEGDGRFGRLDVTIDLLTDVAGFYSFSASLTDALGHELGFAAGSERLEAGSASITLQIPGAPIGERGIDGPYCLSNLVLFGAGQSLIVGQALRISGLTASQFEGIAARGASRRDQPVPESEACTPANRRTFSPMVEALLGGSLRGMGDGQPRP
jgi:hypothetical protein